MSITRRDFLNGVAVAVGAIGMGALTGCKKQDEATVDVSKKTPLAQAMEGEYYPPTKVGLRGNHDGSFEVAHNLSWNKKQYDLTKATNKGEFDLVVVGAGISGLLCAYEFHKAHPNAKILILDNHDDFGGHAKRQEMLFDGGMRITYGGSESFDSPKANFNQDILKLMNELGIDYQKFEKFYDQTFNERHNLKSSVFFNKKSFGKSIVLHEESVFENISNTNEMPLNENDKVFWLEMINSPKDYLGNMPKSEREEFLSGISYQQFLQDYVKAPADVMNILQDICLEYWGFGIDHLSALDAVYEGYPAMSQLQIELDEGESEPYIYHFPDGNAGVARLLVKSLIPAVSTSKDYEKMSAMEAIVLDKFDYSQLDKEENNIKIRLNATCVLAKNINDKVEIGYESSDGLYKITAKHAIMAGNHRLMPYLVPEMDKDKKEAFAQNVKVPLIYAKILVKNWQAFKTLGTYHLYSPKSPYVLVMLDYPVSMGGYQCPDKTDEPMIIHMVKIPVPYGTGKDLREACQMGRGEVYGKSFEELEKEAIDQLSEIYELANDSLSDKVLAVSIHRWSHGYSYEENILYDDEEVVEIIQEKVQNPIGNIHFANSDASWEPYMHGAINQGFRAVREVLNKA